MNDTSDTASVTGVGVIRASYGFRLMGKKGSDALLGPRYLAPRLGSTLAATHYSISGDTCVNVFVCYIR